MYQRPGYGGEHIPQPPSKRPGTVSLLNHLIATHGGRSLGVYNNRSVRGGHATSLHAVSRALDWAYDDRAEADKVIYALTSNNGALAHAMGVQAIHDYANVHPSDRSLARTWGHSRDAWHWGHIGSTIGMHFFHIELTVRAAEDKNLMQKFWLNDNTKQPEHHGEADHDDMRHIPAATLNPGSRGGEVILLQTYLHDWHRAKPTMVSDCGRADGQFGSRTEHALKGMQNHILHVEDDGIYGPHTETALDNLARYLEAVSSH